MTHALDRTLLLVDAHEGRRLSLAKRLAEIPGVRLVGSTGNAYEARDILVAHRPKVVVLHEALPKVSGIQLLERYMSAFPTPTVVLSQDQSLAPFARRAGARAVVHIDQVLDHTQKEKIVSEVKSILPGEHHISKYYDLVAIGSSTGGIAALKVVLAGLPSVFPGIVIAQHMPKGASSGLCDQLRDATSIPVCEAEDGMPIEPGHVVVAPLVDKHTQIRRVGARIEAVLVDGPLRCFQRPAVEALFESAAQALGARAVGVILTGMGSDGARGLLSMRDKGALTIGQDESSSLVYGMPRVAQEIGAVKYQYPLNHIAQALIKHMASPPRRRNVRSTQ